MLSVEGGSWEKWIHLIWYNLPSQDLSFFYFLFLVFLSLEDTWSLWIWWCLYKVVCAISNDHGFYPKLPQTLCSRIVLSLFLKTSVEMFDRTFPLTYSLGTWAILVSLQRYWWEEYEIDLESISKPNRFWKFLIT